MASRWKIALLVGLLLLVMGAFALWFSRGETGRGSIPAPPPSSPDEDAPPPAALPSPEADPDGAGETAGTNTRRVEVHVSEMLEGLVFRPIPGAVVLLRDLGGQTQEALADDAGIAVFENAPPGESEVRASAEGYAASPWRRSDQEKRFVVLERGIGFEGEVLDEIGMRPVEGAKIRVVGGRALHAGGQTFYGLPTDLATGIVLAETVTGPDGRFLTDAVPPYRPVYVFARSHGIGSTFAATQSSSLDGPPTFVVLVLSRSGTLTGTVREPDGQPAAGATVYAAPKQRDDLAKLFHDGSLPLRHIGNPELLSTLTGPDGNYCLEGLNFGVPHVVAAAREGNAPSAPPITATTTIEVPALRRDFRLRLPGKLVVKVLGPGGTPIPNASVMISATNWGSSTVPGSGVHEFWNLRVEQLTLSVRAPEHPSHREKLKIPSGGVAQVTVRLESGIPMVGDVVDGEGRPVAGAEVKARVLDEDGWLRSYATGRTDVEGKVRLEGLLPLVHRVTARAKDLAAGFADHAPRGGPFQIVLQPGGRLRGTVRNQAGGSTGGVIEVAGPDTQRAVLSEDGRYEFRLPPGQYRSRTWTHEQFYWGDWSHAVEVREGQETVLELVAR